MSLITLSALFTVLIVAESALFYNVLSKKALVNKSDLIAVFAGEYCRIDYGYRLASKGFTKSLVLSPATLEKIILFEDQYSALNPNVSLIIEEKARNTFENALYVKRM